MIRRLAAWWRRWNAEQSLRESPLYDHLLPFTPSTPTPLRVDGPTGAPESAAGAPAPSRP